ncbi:hypothetical protein ACFW6S_04295 [Streptomyces sp. NPDC058740]|uniref:hypothetical protein n=1 Tax=Streptomyces sp. NPDC058740 TaxID=3346619 RepID=UPI00367C9A2B
MLKHDIDQLKLVLRRGTDVSAAAVERAYYRVYASTGPWLGLARTRRDATDSPNDRARWDAWIAALTPNQHTVRGTHLQACGVACQGREMLRALHETLMPCPSVGSVAREVERLIRTGALAPSARIRRASLVRRLRVPAAYVDLALADLAAGGLVEIRPNGRAAFRHADGPEPVTGRPQATALGESGVSAA